VAFTFFVWLLGLGGCWAVDNGDGDGFFFLCGFEQAEKDGDGFWTGFVAVVAGFVVVPVRGAECTEFTGLVGSSLLSLLPRDGSSRNRSLSSLSS
jgi:hypothetical protein